MNNSEYQAGVIGTALNLVDDAIEHIKSNGDNVTSEAINDWVYDSALHETIDGDQWIVYYSYNKDVIENSSNPEAWEDIYSQADIGAVLAEKGLTGLYQTLAFFAMYQDVSDEIDGAIRVAMAA